MVHSEMPEPKNHAKGPSFVRLRSAGLLTCLLYFCPFVLIAHAEPTLRDLF